MADDSQERVRAAREGSDEGELCQALVARAADAVEESDPDSAIADLREASELHEKAGRVKEASHCASQAAAIARLGGAIELSLELSSRAVELAGDDDDFARPALLERGESALLIENVDMAADAFGRARKRAGNADRELVIAMAMKHAEALILLGDYEGAEAAWKDAEALADSNEEVAEILVRRATLLTSAAPSIAPAAQVRAKMAAIALGDPKLLADVALIDCTQAIQEGEPKVALAAARRARELALQCDGAMTYAAAAAIIARLCEELGDRRGAYESLSVGWVSLEKLLGEDLARATFRPLLEDMRERWGPEAFDAIKRQAESAA